MAAIQHREGHCRGRAGVARRNVGADGYPKSMEPQIDDVALLALYLTPGFSWAKTRARIEAEGSPAAVLRAQYSDQLFSDEYDQALARAESFRAEIEAQNTHVASLWSPDYPRHLHTVHDAPPVLFWQGQMDPRDEEAVAIVGTRTPDNQGTHFAETLAHQLAVQDIPVVSGLARGIDGIALRAALATRGRVIGVIGTGHDIAYPPEHEALQHEIAQHLLISQFAPGTTISKRNFPMRNAVMSGFASMTVIVQAGETSGTRIQARAAVKHGRPIIISTAVLHKTDWAKQLVHQGYDVTVVADADQAFDAVRSIHGRRSAVIEGWEPSAYLVG